MGRRIAIDLGRSVNVFLTRVVDAQVATRPIAIVRKVVLDILGITGDSVTLLVEGQRMVVPWQFVGSYVLSPYEPLTTHLFKQAIRPGMTVLDIGAHIGYYSLLSAKLVGPEGRVFAFEPDPYTSRVLERSVSLNSLAQVTVLRKAVDEKVGTRDFILAQSSEMNSLYHHHLSAEKAKLRIECVAIDNMFGESGVDVIKMDIEGGELAALRGMTQTIEKSPRLTMFVEFNPACLIDAGHVPSQLIKSLCELGLEVRLIDDKSGVTRRIDPKLEGYPVDDPHWWANLLCKKRSPESKAVV